MSAATGIRHLVPVGMRHDGPRIAPWVVLISALVATSVLAYNLLFTDAASIRNLTVSLSANPAFSLLFGPVEDLSTVDAFTTWRSLALGDFFAGMMAIFIVTRNSRAHEDSNQAELVASGVVGRSARLLAAVAMAAVAAVVLGVVSWVVNMLCGGEPIASLWLSATLTASALVFAGVAAITSQLASTAGAANSIAIVVLGAAYLLRGIADSTPGLEELIWWTPLGWAERIEPVGAQDWRPLVACVGLAVVLVAVAALLQSRRDYGAALIPQRAGRARGGLVASSWGLALRLNRASVIGWLIGFALIGTVLGNVAASIGDEFTKNPVLRQIITASGGASDDLIFAYMATLTHLLAIIASAFGVQVMMRMYSEESTGRTEAVLAGAITRQRHLAGHAAIAFLAPAVALALGTAALTVSARAAGSDVDAGELLVQGLLAVPAVWVIVALAVALVGARPAARLLAWIAVVAMFGLTILGPTFNLWEWVLAISPLWHIPDVSASDADWWQLLCLALVIVLFTAIGFIGYRRRDLRFGKP
ncbi:ABC transporter permease [Ruicaihuangia caeni]|uniref:Multidrug ABC transporter permease n=1 Tax=Ruicaihuangia caeni TaxID=3042517 RepID=A0AAW6T403_9MICO|nr:multidrug ABC transporter permease [Klugiella sp. YN-L-19]MDI2098174.1 multidrug ABC transporter permease [Klugiella sp. YN-L-19]